MGGIREIRQAARDGKQVTITYSKKGIKGKAGSAKTVRRKVSVYEDKAGKIWVDHHGQTKSLIKRRIVAAVVTKTKAQPIFPVNM